MSNELPVIKPGWLVGITMTSEQKAKWLAALRGGRYKQGNGELLCDGRYCCLGVYARVVHGFEKSTLEGKVQLCDLDLDRDLGPWPELYCHSDPESWNGIQAVLAGMNDNNKSFREIADFIEKNIPACDEVKS